MPQHSSELYFFFAIFLAVIGLTFFIFLPFVSVLAVSAVFAVLFHPLYHQVKTRVVSRESIAAALVVLIVILGVLAPLFVIGYMVFAEARDVVVALSNDQGRITETLDAMTYRVAQYLPGFEIDLREHVRTALVFFTQSLGPIFAKTASILFSLFLGLIAFFYFLKDGPRFRDFMIAYSPLRDTFDHQILEKLKLTINSVIKGSLFIALLQGVLSGIGLAIFGVPNPILWGSLAALGALIPSVGTALILVPAIIYLFVIGSVGPAVGLLIWSVLAVGLIDNFLGPHFIGRGVRIHPFFVLLSVLGGVAFFGPSGFILGPLALSLLVVLGEMYVLMSRQHV